MDLLNASSRVAFAAFIHDLGKLAHRADFPVSTEKKETHIQLYCPYHKEGGWWSHHHAAYTSLAFDVIERNAPDLIRGEMFPFASRSREIEITDSLVNAAAMHHRPQTLLQWIIATADRVASGFEREEFESYNNNGNKQEEVSVIGKNHLQSRLLTLFEQIQISNEKEITSSTLKWCYPLKPLSPESIFPCIRENHEPNDNETARKQYRELWDSFVEGIERIPESHRKSWSLWLDHFDTAWLTYTHAVPSATAFGTKPDVSLYDHSKTTAALATALWRYHYRNPFDEKEAVLKISDRTDSGDWNDQKFLLIQGDFFGIQDFIFAAGSQTNRQAAKLLRGRSFYVSLLMEIAALKVLETLELPSTSQIINAAGKFLIVAENSIESERKLNAVYKELNQWFLEHTYGMAGIGLVWKSASCNDFLKTESNQTGFSRLMLSLFDQLDMAKLQRFSLAEQSTPVFPLKNFDAPCQWYGCLPSDGVDEDGRPSCALSRDQILIGERLVKSSRILILKSDSDIRRDNLELCELSIFGYRVAFTQEEKKSGKFAQLISEETLRRCWDFSLPENMTSILWQGYARRNINGYIPRFEDKDLLMSDKYNLSEELLEENPAVSAAIKTFNHIACEDRQFLQEEEKWMGQTALTVLKGDVDNLGQIFQRGLQNCTFAKMAALSRQMNSFFAIWLPAICRIEFENTYTIFAGGDDFFMMGPWRKTQKLAGKIATLFNDYTTCNPEIHLSAGMIMSKPGYPVNALAEAAEIALGEAKGFQGKNAVHLFKQTVSWNDWEKLNEAEDRLGTLVQQYQLPSGYVYDLLSLIDLASQTDRPEASMWRSKLAYRTSRMLDRITNKELKRQAQIVLVTDVGEKGIATFRGAYCIPVFNFFYSQR